MLNQKFVQYFDTEFQAWEEPRVSEMNSSLRLRRSSQNRSRQAPYNKVEACKNFLRGKCYLGGNCKFAHGKGTKDGGKLRFDRGDFLGSEMRGSEKLCRWFISGKSCPYGKDCIFSHSNAAEADQEILPMPRKNAVITLVDDFQAVVNRRRSDEYSRERKTQYWKTRLCDYWKRTGTCQNGVECNFAHGEADIQEPGSLRVQETGKTDTAETWANAASAKSPVLGRRGHRVEQEQLENGKRRFWWDNVKQVNGIYGDWID